MVPLPTIEEQLEIVRRIEVAYQWLDKIATEHARAEHLLPKLDQAILAKAFRGELVPQDPNDSTYRRPGADQGGKGRGRTTQAPGARMKKPKKVAATDKAPETDADALLDIVAWSAARPAWQQQALRHLAQSDQLSTVQLDELYKLVLDGGAAASPVSESDLRSPKSQAAAVTLKAVSKPEDVNALAADQTLSFEKAGLTIIYGDNGAGKSGYARILKHACRARIDSKAAPIIPNIYTAAPGTPRANVSYVVNGQNKNADWQLGQASPPELSAVSVFDARTAHVHVDGTNEVAYVPSSLDLMQRLARTADQLRDKCKAAKTGS